MKTRASSVRNDARSTSAPSRERVTPKGHITDVRSGALPSSGSGHADKKPPPEPRTKIVERNGVLTVVTSGNT